MFAILLSSLRFLIPLQQFSFGRTHNILSSILSNREGNNSETVRMLLPKGNLWLSLKKRLQKIGVYQLTENQNGENEKYQRRKEKRTSTAQIVIEAIKMNCFRLVMFPSIVHFILFWLAWIVSGSSKCLEILTEIYSSVKADEERRVELTCIVFTPRTQSLRKPYAFHSNREIDVFIPISNACANYIHTIWTSRIQ